MPVRVPNKKPVLQAAFAVQPDPPPPPPDLEDFVLFARVGIELGIPSTTTISGLSGWKIGHKPENYDTLPDQPGTEGNVPTAVITGGATDQGLISPVGADGGDSLTPSGGAAGITVVYDPPIAPFNSIGVTVDYDGDPTFDFGTAVIRGEFKGVELLVFFLEVVP